MLVRTEHQTLTVRDTFSPGDEEDEATRSLTEVLSDPEIIGVLSRMVCIKVENGSTTCRQFAAIYPVILVPSVYFIGSQPAEGLALLSLTDTTLL